MGKYPYTESWKITLESLNVGINIKDGGMIEVTFPNASIIETESGPVMGFVIDPELAMYLAGSIIHAAFTVAEHGDGDDDGEEDDDK